MRPMSPARPAAGKIRHRFLQYVRALLVHQYSFILLMLSDSRAGGRASGCRILIRHAIEKGLLKHDPSAGIKRPKSRRIRAWTDSEMAAYEQRWPLGTKQRTAYALMLGVGTARVDVHRMTWTQVDFAGVGYTRNKSGVAVDIGLDTGAAPGRRAAVARLSSPPSSADPSRCAGFHAGCDDRGRPTA